MPKPIGRRTQAFSESVIREMTRLARQYHAINLAQGFPDFPCPDELKQAAIQAIQRDQNQYSFTWGSPRLRAAIAEKASWFNGLDVDPERHITVACGATECMIAALLAVTEPGDEVIIFEPFYENYGPGCWLSGAQPRFVPLRPPQFSFDRDELRVAFGPRTRAIIVNTPNNPSGHVFSREELAFIAGLCQEFDCLAITDEIYEHIVFDGHQHISLATLPGMWERTITISGLSKTYAVTGWRVGWAIAPEDLTNAIRKVHDFLTVCAPAPLQEAGVVALRLPREYYTRLAEDYARKRDILLQALAAAGFHPWTPQGAYYILCDLSAFGAPDDVRFAQALAEQARVTCVPGSSFYQPGSDLGRQQVRFTFSKKDETLREAAERLSRIGDALRPTPLSC